MSNFAALMALSATQTRQSEAAVQSALAERERREALKRKQQEEKDRKDREMEAKLRLKRFEEEKRAQERQKKMELEKAAKEREMKRKEDEQRNALLYGPKKSKSGYPSSSLGGHEARRRNGSDDESGSGNALTREEKRKRQYELQMRYGTGSKKSTPSTYRKAGSRLPGGAINAISTTEGSASGVYRSTKERLTKELPGLIKLNTVKRDTRTIDEIVQDIAKTKEGKVLAGDDAREFADWFGKGGSSKAKAKPESRGSSIFGGTEGSEAEPDAPTGSKPVTKIPGGSKSSSATPPVQARGTTTPKSAAPPAPSKPANGIIARGSSISVKAVGRPVTERPASSFFTKPGANNKLASKPSLPSLKTSSSTRPSASTSASRAPASAGASTKKRPRSSSLSVSPPPPRKRSLQTPRDDISSEIWKIFGKDRRSYVTRDVLSDDEDMEAGVDDVMEEEAISSRIARREEELALEEERRHEEEKRRKRKEREKRML